MTTKFDNGNFVVSCEAGNFTVLIVKQGKRYSVEKIAGGVERKYPITKAELSKEIHDLFDLPTRAEMNKKWPVTFEAILDRQSRDLDFLRMVYIHQKRKDEGE